ncbi:hypothetical protein QFC22_004759 [Naganishia vaughanmartiniae]|uniref:Uncharacterized protein n=1 Tax=Naganishia vaughanmartiniae TaxID=1424756 RepID=A0ACC2WX72_9TREE|nr:hypothetical protein QFC22_004759 [Naganishia vaughanmartiniae]
MPSSPTGTVTVTQTQTVTYTSKHHQNTPYESHARPEHSSPGAPPGSPPPPPPQEGYPYSMPSPPPPQPGFPFEPYMHPGQVPPPMVIPLGGGPPSYQAGTVMDPLTAIISIVVVAAMYWGFKNGTTGLSGFMPGDARAGAATAAAEAKPEDPKKSSSSSRSSSSSKDKKGEEDAAPAMPAIPAVSPAAFISLIAFAILAAVIIQGPLGLKAAFSGQDAISSRGEGASSSTGASLGLSGLLDILSARLPTFPSGSAHSTNSYSNNGMPGVVPQMAGQGSSSDKNGHSQWNWYANPIPVNQQGNVNMGQMQGTGIPGQGRPPSEMDKLAFAGLPPLLQSMCESQTYLHTSLTPRVLQHFQFVRKNPSCVQV